MNDIRCLMTQNEPILTADSILLDQLHLGDKKAFDILFDRYWQKTFSETYKRIKEYDAAKDIVQEIFIHLWVNKDVIRIQNLPAYLNVAVRNRVVKFCSKQKITHPFFNLLDTLPEKNSRADGALLWKDFLNSYEAILKTLPRKRQMIFRLRYQEDLPTKFISAHLGIKRKTVQNHLGKAIETLKVSLLRLLSLSPIFWLFMT